MSAEMRRWVERPDRAILFTATAKGHPQGNGLAEKHVQNIKRATMAAGWRKPLSDAASSWYQIIVQMTEEYNKTPREYDRRAGYSVVTSPASLYKGVDPQDMPNAVPIAARRQAVVDARRAQEIDDGGLNAACRETRAYKVGDEVWWRTPVGASRGPKALKKFKYEGPYIVTEIKSRRDQSNGSNPPQVPLTYVIRHVFVRSQRPADEHKIVNVQDLRPGESMRLADYRAAAGGTL